MAGICASISLVIVGDHLLAYSKIESSPRKTYYIGVIMMAPVCMQCRFALWMRHPTTHMARRSRTRTRRCPSERGLPPPQVFAITNFLALFFPRAALLFELIQHMYEARTTWPSKLLHKPRLLASHQLSFLRLMLSSQTTGCAVKFYEGVGQTVRGPARATRRHKRCTLSASSSSTSPPARHPHRPFHGIMSRVDFPHYFLLGFG